LPHVYRRHFDRSTETMRNIVDRIILSRTTGYSIATIRKWCVPLGYDQASGRALYDHDAVLDHLKACGVIARPETRGPRARRRAPR
jgi:hypothetical protein